MKTDLLLLTYVISLASFLILDFIWLGIVARGFYRGQLGHLLSPDVRWAPAFVFYAIFVAAVLVFATLPALSDGSFARAAMLGGFFGFVAYATYDLTNLATLKDWPDIVVLVDMAWGTILSASVAAIGYQFASRFV